MTDWYALLAIEGLPTTDQRIVMPEGLSWNNDLLPLMFIRDQGIEHEATDCGGAIESITRQACWILAEGSFSYGKEGEFLERAVATAADCGTPLGIGLDLILAEPDPDVKELPMPVEGRVIGAHVYADGRSRPAWPMCSIIPVAGFHRIVRWK